MANRRVQIMAIDAKYRYTKVWAAPTFDDVKQVFTVGGKTYAAKQPRNPTKDFNFITDDTCPMVLTDSYTRQLQHGDTFDMDDPEQKMLLDMAIDNGFLAPNKAAINPGSNHVFYVKDEIQEARESSTKADRVFEALTLTRKMSGKDQMSFAFFCNQPARTMSAEMIESFIKELAMKDPDRIIKAVANDDWKTRSFIHKATHYGIITVEGGVHKIGKDVIGIDEDSAVYYVTDSKNKDMMIQIKKRLDEEMALESQVPA